MRRTDTKPLNAATPLPPLAGAGSQTQQNVLSAGSAARPITARFDPPRRHTAMAADTTAHEQARTTARNTS